MILLLGEVGGIEELHVAAALKDGRIKKPLLAWCLGVCAGLFGAEVQFGHAGARAGADAETAEAKNAALAAAGAIVPCSFEDLPQELSRVFRELVDSGVLVPAPEKNAPRVPVDYAWAQELGLVRKPAHFVSTICDDRGEELLYAGVPVSAVIKEELGVGGVLSLLWFKRRLPSWSCRFIEIVLQLVADHGPAVSGAHNTIVSARAGKDLVSALASGLLTIGDRFGGALDGAAAQFSEAYDQAQSAKDFVTSMRAKRTLILGIGHRIKSKSNPDLRVTILIEYARKVFPATPLLDFALEVEALTVAKKENLILNVDGAIAVLFVDLLRSCGSFTRAEADEYVRIGALNGLFVLGRSMGFIGHYLDQRRLKQGLYRHPWDDISYLSPDQGRYQN
jgi:ATP citrate (pro-S)-lyase